MPDWFDAHNHLQDRRLAAVDDCVAAAKAAGVTGAVVNATSEDDWEIVADLAARQGGWIRPALGVHPWRAHEVKDGWLDRLREQLERDSTASVGEVGLDGWVDHPSLDIQRPVFLDQLRLARELGRPLTIHCLKAWNPFLELLKDDKPPPVFLMHSFSGSIELARQLIPMGAYFSFSGYFLTARKRGVIEVFRELPKDRILVETDAPDMAPPDWVVRHPLDDGSNHPANLPAIGEALAEALDMPANELAGLTADNARKCFGY